MLKILIEDADGKSKATQIDPSSTDITIGRKEGNFIRLKERNVSRHHARIFNGEDGNLYIEPVAARYGLKVNSKKIEGPTQIALGDEIKIGDYHLYIQDANTADVRKDDQFTTEVVDIQPQLQPRFIVISSNFAGVEYHVTRSKVTIGRNTECDISIQHNSISDVHAEVRRNARGDFEIIDMQSTNGTKVNGIPINEPFRLSSGDAVTLGHVTMRYCGPGDLWSLNFGINETHRNNALPIIMGVIAICIAIIGLGLILSWRNTANSGTPIPESAVAEQTQQNEQLALIMQCDTAMRNGDLDRAEELCGKAGRINPKFELYKSSAEQLKREIAAKNTLEELKAYLDDNMCRKAIDLSEAIEKNTWAYRYMLDNNLKNRALECLDLFHYERAMKAIAAEDWTTAEIARDEIKQSNSHSPYIEKINDAIQNAKKPARSGGDGSSKPRTGGGGSSSKAAAPAEDANELCKQAGMAKIKGDKCKAVSLYKKAIKMSGVDAKCKKNGEDTIKANPSCK